MSKDSEVNLVRTILAELNAESSINSLFQIRKHETVDVLIDGDGIYKMAKSLGFNVDYKNLRAMFANNMRLNRIYYFAMYNDSDDAVYSPIIPLMDWAGYNGFTVVDKPLRMDANEEGAQRFRSTMTGEMTVQLMESSGKVDNIVVISGNADLMAGISRAKKGSRVMVLANNQKDTQNRAADEIRRAADHFVALNLVQDQFTREERFQESRLTLASSGR